VLVIGAMVAGRRLGVFNERSHPARDKRAQLELLWLSEVRAGLPLTNRRRQN